MDSRVMDPHMTCWVVKAGSRDWLQEWGEKLAQAGLRDSIRFFPLMDIQYRFPASAKEAQAQLTAFLRADRIVLTSAHAVHGLGNWLKMAVMPDAGQAIELQTPGASPLWCAVGASTARLLAELLNKASWGTFGAEFFPYGFASGLSDGCAEKKTIPVIYPPERAGLQALLSLPIWDNVQQVGLVTGVGGRDDLQRYCASKRIPLWIIETYQRHWLPLDRALWQSFDASYRTGTLQALWLLSQEQAERWWEQYRMHYQASLDPPCLENIPVFVPSEVLAERIWEWGFKRITVLPSPDPAQIVLAWKALHTHAQ